LAPKWETALSLFSKDTAKRYRNGSRTKFRNLSITSSGVARGGQVGARALGRRPWGRNSTLFAAILNVFLSRNLDQSKLKNVYFLRKNCKNRLSIEGSALELCLPPAETPALLLPPTITTLSSLFLVLNAFYSAQKKKQVTSAKFCLSFFRIFASIF